MIEMFRVMFSDALFAFVVPGLVIGSLSIFIGACLPSLLNKYKLVLIVSGVLVVLFFTFHAGRHREVIKYEQKILIQKVLIAELKTKSAKIETKVITEYVDKIKFVEKIKEVKTNVYVTQKDDSACVISADASADISRLLNSAGRGQLPPAPRTLDGKAR